VPAKGLKRVLQAQAVLVLNVVSIKLRVVVIGNSRLEFSLKAS
jgi:hypothetical protein